VLGTLAALSLGLLPGCSRDPPWAEQAAQCIEARDRAAHRSIAELMSFESPDTVHLLCCNQAEPFHGRGANAVFLRDGIDRRSWAGIDRRVGLRRRVAVPGRSGR
jgi:hypothetical protein